jgi:RHS repeat-associated protein
MRISHRSSRAVAAILVLVASSVLTIAAGRGVLGRKAFALQERAVQGRDRPAGSSVTVLPDGTVLIVGGRTDGVSQSVAWLLDPETQTVSSVRGGLNQGRSGHSATLLADGTVVVIGGIDSEGNVVDSMELFESRTLTFRQLQSHVPSRSGHSATLLVDGRVLLAGGVDPNGAVVGEADIWDPTSGAVEHVPVGLARSRTNHSATLLPDGRVRIAGGVDANGGPLGEEELFDATTQAFSAGETTEGSVEPEFVLETTPIDGAVDVPTTLRASLRFGTPIQVRSFSDKTVILSTANAGAVPVQVTPAEAGRLVFIRPLHELAPGRDYSLVVQGARDFRGQPLPRIAISFRTAEHAANPEVQPTDDETWQPDGEAIRTGWRTGRPPSPWEKLPPLRAAPGVTAVSGRVLRLNGQPLAHVKLSIDETVTWTDNTGRFLLAPLDAGHRKLLIDGRTASTPGRAHGVYEVGVMVDRGVTNVLPFASWSSRIDSANAVTISSPTTSETVIRTPAIPGLEVHIPAGTVIRDVDGAVVTQISITPVPVDRPPFPLPRGVYVPIYFTIQPGGAHLYTSDGQPAAARIYYPNYGDEAVGKRFDFWHYDPHHDAAGHARPGQGWYVYGHGGVSLDRRQIIPDVGIGVREFSGAMVANPGFAPVDGPEPCNECTDGDPVDLGTGLFVTRKTDLVLPDAISLVLTRTYRNRDDRSRGFGIGATHNYDIFMVGDRDPYTYQDLILPDGGRIHYQRISAGTGFQNAVYEHDSTPSRWYKSRIVWTSGYWTLTLQDGSLLTFPDAETATNPMQGAVRSMTDRLGNVVTLVRDATTAKLTRISSNNGRHAIDLTYDASRRIIQAKDTLGRTVGYQYDAGGRLWKVTNPGNGVTEYTYDTLNRMTAIKDARGITYVNNVYDGGGRVIRQTLADGAKYQFAYTVNGSNQVTQADVTDPRGFQRRVTFNGDGYWLSDARALGRPEQQTFTVQRTSPGNFVSSYTDAMGRQTAYGHDGAGNTTTVTRLAGTAAAVPVTATYNATQQVTSVTDPLNHTTRLDYDGRGALLAITDPLGHGVTVVPDGAGQPITITDAAGTSSVAYDAGLASALTDALGNTTRVVRDGSGRPVFVIDPLGRTKGITYDALNRPLKIIDGQQGVTELSYDENGNVKTLKDARTGLTQFTYDAMDRVESRTDPLLQTEYYRYDAAGRVIEIVDRKGQLTRVQYDALGRTTRTDFADGSYTTFAYDAGNRVTQITDSVAGSVVRTFDDLDRMTTETTPKGAVSYGYDVAGRLTSTTVSGQPQITYTYDDANRLTEIAQGGRVVTMTYDAADRRSSQTLPNGILVEASYDAASRLTGLTYSRSGTVFGTLTYAYDAAGQRTEVGGSLARTLLPSAVSSATYDAANRLTQWGGVPFTYDANGNLATAGSRTFGWDARNRLSAVGGTATIATFGYDGLRRRTSISFGSGATDLLYDGQNIIQESSGGVTTANLLVGHGLDDVITRTDSSGEHTILADALGSTVALTDNTGAISTTYTYSAFGQTTATGQSTASTNRFSGREADATGLYYYRARYYDPALGRFLSEDPAGFGAGDPNLYAYVFNSPTNLTDPTGQFAVAPWLAACGYGALMDLGADFLSRPLDAMGRRKGSWSDIQNAAPRGCASGLVGAGIGKALGGLANAFLTRAGQRVYRTWGQQAANHSGMMEGSRPYGPSWTPVDPRSVGNVRDGLGLPTANRGRFVSEGVLEDSSGCVWRPANPIDGNMGGLPEIVVPSPATQIRLTGVFGVNPPH